ncbi:hypothetical protein EV643_103135 [Kribbella sp. VKM Ac-2527]|uniref:DUF222 domain-containing protein n=1 Tax=Kribbella caucasensis TaxID=2512215 RepID=A0A4R6KJD3_9ACTN|nr:hypothetical protein [Kribbella sp. VKM Ac-2527]TDO51398.1 hypothetical protein EV643_103135 [Kribbella sp. VKM Ac-2527]
MFEGDLSGLTAAEVLASAAEHHATAREHEVSVLVHAQQFAALHSVDTLPRRDRGGQRGRERGVVLGGAGCPEIAEFAPAEFGAVVLGVSAGVAAEFVGQALALLHRLPRCWAMVQAYEATPWKARKIATACLHLSLEAAALVDHEVAGIIDSVTPARLTTIVKAALWKADPEAAAAAAKQKQRERGVYVAQSDDNGTKAMYVLAASGDVIRFDATINSIADALKTLGDTDPLRLRRARAIGILADPDYTLALLTAAQEARTAATAPANPAASADPATSANRPSAAARPAAAVDSADPADTADPADPVDATDPSTSANPARPTRPADDLATAPVHAGPAATNDPADPAAPVDPVGPAESAHSTDPVDDTDLGEWWMREPDDETDRDAPHPSTSDLPDPLDTPPRRPPPDPGNPTPTTIDDDDAEPMDTAARRALNATLNRLDGIAPGTSLGGAGGRARSGRAAAGTGGTVVYVHLTHQTLATGTGVLRVENLGPLLADQLAELIGHRPYIVKPVIDLNHNISVDAYEIPARIRERIKLTYPVEQFPYGTAHTTNTTDLDHIQPYDPLGPTEQTSTTNLAPLRRFTHRLKTHGRWQVRRLDDGALEWTSPHRFTFRVDHRGTHPTWPTSPEPTN